MVQHSGQRDTLIVIERSTATTDDLGQDVETWAEFTRGYAAQRWGSGSERLAVAQTQAEQGCTFTVLTTAAMVAVTPGDRILAPNGQRWNIVAIATIGRHEVAFTVTRNVAA